MKKPIQLLGFIALLALLTPSFALAGIESGDWRIAAGISTAAYDETKIDGTKFKTTTFAIAPNGLLQIGRVLDNHVELGIKLGAAFEEIEVGRTSLDATTLEFIPYVALNIPVGPIKESGSYYFSPSVGIGYSGSFGDTLEIDAFIIEAGAEAKFFVAKDASIDIGLFISYLSGDARTSAPAFAFRGNFDIKSFTIGPRITISIWP